MISEINTPLKATDTHLVQLSSFTKSVEYDKQREKDIMKTLGENIFNTAPMK